MEPEEAERALKSLGCRGEKSKGAGEGECETADPSRKDLPRPTTGSPNFLPQDSVSPRNSHQVQPLAKSTVWEALGIQGDGLQLGPPPMKLLTVGDLRGAFSWPASLSTESETIWREILQEGPELWLSHVLKPCFRN